MNADLAFGKKSDGFLPLGMKHTHKRPFHAAEWIESHGRNNADVDADIAADDVILELARPLAAGCENGVTIVHGYFIAQFDGLVQIF